MLRRTVVQIEILSDEDEPIGDLPLGTIIYQITEGGWSGEQSIVSDEEVTPERMSELLIAQGSDPDFLVSEPD